MTVQHYCYGSICSCDTKHEVDDMSDIEQTASRGESSPLVGHKRENDIAMRPLADQTSDHDSTLSEETCDSAQAGVKRLEAISSIWSKKGLSVAYLGYIASH